MTENGNEKSTPNYTMGYDEAFMEFIRARVAATHAGYLLPHLKPEMRMLDIGCGPGTISVGLAEAVAPGELVGIDMAESQIEIATAAAERNGLSNARFQVADALNLPFPNDHFDAVHTHAVLMHIPDTKAVIAEIMRVLKPGGVLGSREYIADASFGVPDIGKGKEAWDMYRDLVAANGGHPQMGRELRTRFSEAGLVGVESTGAFESFGDETSVAAFTGFIVNYMCGPAIADQVISHGIATQKQFDEWREDAVRWQNEPGAFAAIAWGEAIGWKP